MMLNWAKTEALAIQEGNLLTSVTKSQPYLISSNYVKGVQLLKQNENGFATRISLGAQFTPHPPMDGELKDTPVVRRIGFLHSQVFYRVPSEQGFVLAFDLESPVLTFAFFGSVAVLVLILVGLISLLRYTEAKESERREQLLKLAVNDLILKDSATDLLDQQFPEISGWWKDKKREWAEINRHAIENDNKIILGEMASRLAHDIKNPLRNIRTLVKRTTGLDESQTNNLQNSILKIDAIASTISARTQQILSVESDRRSIVDLMALISKVVDEKSGRGRIRLTNSLSDKIECYLNPLEFERSFANLLENAAQATQPNGAVEVSYKADSSEIKISITDFGKGISSENLKKVGIKGFSHGKKGGTGLGVYYAKKFVDESGGRFTIASTPNKGTTVTITLPTINESTEIPASINLRSGMSVAFLDDDPLVLKSVASKFQSVQGSDEVEIKLFQKSSELEAWIAVSPADFLVVTDFNLEGESESGLDVIERLGLTKHTWVFTSAPDDEKLRAKARRLGVPVIGKDVFFALNVVTPF